MRSKLSIVLAATVSLGTFAFAADPPAGSSSSSDLSTSSSSSSSVDQQKSGPLQLPAGFRQKDLNEKKDVEHELANLTEDAGKTKHFDNLLGNLVDQDRDRLKKDAKNLDTASLDSTIDQFRKTWHDKYGKDFDPKTKAYEGFVQVATGEVDDPAVAVNSFPVDPRTGMPAKDKAVQASEQQHEANKLFGGDVKLDKGRNVALARIPASHDAPELTVSLIHELPDMWRIDIPNDRTAQQVLNDLQTHMTNVNNMSAQWPSDINDAYRMVTHHVLMGLYGLPETQRG